jgi:hypothetical protein
MRRRDVLSLGTGLLLADAVASAADLAPAGVTGYRFKVSRKGTAIGSHSVELRRASSRLEAITRVELAVKIAFITAFRFEHSGSETWEQDRLVALSGDTNQNGERFRVTGQPTAKGFRVEGPAGPVLVDAGTLTSNALWSTLFVRQSLLINAQQGGELGLVATAEGGETITVQGRKMAARRHRFVSPTVAGLLWFDDAGRWVQARLEIQGEQVDYALAA